MHILRIPRLLKKALCLLLLACFPCHFTAYAANHLTQEATLSSYLLDVKANALNQNLGYIWERIKTSKGVIFDLDGVLLDTVPIHRRAWYITLGKYVETVLPELLEYGEGNSAEVAIRLMIGDGHISVPPHISQTNFIMQIATEKRRAFKNLIDVDGVPLLPGVIYFLGKLKQEGIRLSIGSAGPQAKMLVEKSELRSFFNSSWVVTSNGKNTKPHPDIFEIAAARMGFEKDDYSEIVVIGDAENDMQAGENGNFGFLLGLNHERTGEKTEKLMQAGAHAVIPNLSVLNNFIDQLRVENPLSTGSLNRVSLDSSFRNFLPLIKSS